MPNYDYACDCGKTFERYLPLAEYAQPQVCECGLVAQKIILKAPMAVVQPDICYDSPIDGRPITSKQARIEDLARSNCVPYDPEQKTDYLRRNERQQAELEAKMEATVDREIAQMPSRKRERLAAEMEGGMDVVPERYTASAKPIVETINHG